MPILPSLLGWMIRRDLRGAFRRVCWVGPELDVPAGMPLAIYANHHSFYDGYLLWYWLNQHLGRPIITWMAEWDTFPLFSPLGVLPFPEEDARRRLTTIRTTARRMREHSNTALFYFPEARLHAPEEGILPFDETAFSRFDRLFPEKRWVPIAIHVSWWGEAQPTALLSAGTPHAAAAGDEHLRLLETWESLRQSKPGDGKVLFEGRHSPNEQWDLSITRRFFSRYIR